MIILVDTRNIQQNPTLIHDKNFQQTKNRRKLSQLHIEYIKKSTASNILTLGKPDALLLCQVQFKNVPRYHYLL